MPDHRTKNGSLRIFIIINHLKSGGAEKQCIYLTKVLTQYYETRLIVYNGNLYDNRMLLLLKGINDKVIWLKGNNLFKLLSIYKLLSRHKNTAAISYLARANFINGVIGSLAGVKLRIGGIRSSKHSPTKLLMQRLLHNHLLTCSVFNNQAGFNLLILKGFNPKKGFVIHNGIEINNKPIIRTQKNKIVILSVGRFVEAKDYKTALKSFANLKGNNKSPYSFKYIIVGHGHLEREIRNFAKNQNIDAFIEFVINPDSLTPYYKQADIFLSTSLYEGLSNAIMEAMEFSLPIIATNVGDNAELIKHGVNGFLVPAKDSQIITHKLLLLSDNYDLRINMGQQSYYHLNKNFSIEKFSLKNISLIKDLSS